MVSEPGIHFVNEDIVSFVEKLRQQEGETIWLCGGANLLQPLINANLIDEYQISIMPHILGGGTRLFQGNDTAIKLSLVSSENINGVLCCPYKNK